MSDMSSVGLKCEKLVKNGKLNIYTSLLMILSGNDYELDWYNEDEKGINIISQEHKYMSPLKYVNKAINNILIGVW